MSTIAIGDVHGNRAALDDLLTRINRDVSALDTVVFLGDYIDRGPDSKGVIESILRFRAESPATVVTLLGNHEAALLQTFDAPHRYSWLTIMEGFATVRSYSADAADALIRAVETAGPRLVLEQVALPYDMFFEAIPPSHLAFLRQLQVFRRTSDCVCVHGGLDPRGGPVEAQTRDAMIWGTPRFLEDYAGDDIVMYGHRDDARLDQDGWPEPNVGRGTVGVDTISHGILTGYRLPDRRVFQSDRFRAG